MKGPTPTVEETQQRAKEPTPTIVVPHKREEPRAAKSEATPDQPDQGNEQVLSDLGSEQVLTPKISPKQPEQQPEPPLSTQSTPTEGGEHGCENNTCQQWLRWLAQQVSDVADQLDGEERRREHLMQTTTEELVTVRGQLQTMGEELTRAKESTDSRAEKGQQSNVTTERKATPEPEAEPVMEEALQTGTESAQVIKTLREELAAQEELREKEREQRKLAEDERRRIEEGLRKTTPTTTG